MAVCLTLLITVLDQVVKDIPQLGDGDTGCDRVERVEYIHGLARREQGTGDNVDARTQSIGVDGLAHYELARRVRDRHFDLCQPQRVFSGISDGKIEVEQLPALADLDEGSDRRCVDCDLVRLSPY